VSDSLPELKQAEIRGLPQLDIATVDLPPHVRNHLARLEKGNALSVDLLVPWIATRQIARGYEGPIDPRAILRRAADSYGEALLAVIATDPGDGRNRISEIVKQFELAQAALAGKNRDVALRALRDAERLVGQLAVAPTNRAVPSALNLILQYVMEQVR
jgi:hypothetical protein